MSDDLMERYESAVQKSDGAAQYLCEMIQAHSGDAEHPEFVRARHGRGNKAIREAGLAREVIAALAARITELEAEHAKSDAWQEHLGDELSNAQYDIGQYFAERDALQAQIKADAVERFELLGLLMDDLAHLGFYGWDGIFDTARLSNAYENCEVLARHGLAQRVTPGDDRYWRIFPDKLSTMEANK